MRQMRHSRSARHRLSQQFAINESKPAIAYLQRSCRDRTFQICLATAIVIAIIAALLPPVQALTARISPATAQLGDTLLVTIPLDSSTSDGTPKVKLGSKVYPSFRQSDTQFRALLPTTPLDRPGKLAVEVEQGENIQTLAVALEDRSFPTQRIWLPPGKDGDVSDYEYDRVDAFKQIVTPEKFWTGPMLRPNQGEITTIYGVRRYYNGVFAKDYYHRGVDYAGPVGSPIKAPAAGRVALVGRESQGFQVHGNCVGLDHGQGVESIFLHLSRIDVKEGDFVQAGQVIGALGGTGAATGPHLHWGLYVHGQSVDPVPWRTKGFD